MTKFILILACLGILVLLSHATRKVGNHGKPLPTAVLVIAMTAALTVAEAITVVEAVNVMERITVAETITAATALTLAAAIMVSAAIKFGKPTEVGAIPAPAKQAIYLLVSPVTTPTEASSR